MLRRPICCLLFLFITFAAAAQSRQVPPQRLVWLRYSERVILNPSWSVYGEMETRRFFLPDRQHSWLVPRLVLFHKINSTTDAGFGTAFFLQALPQTDAASTLLRPEIRPHQEITLQQKLGLGKLSHRFMVEERFIRKSQDNLLTTGWDFSMRLRYRGQWQMPLTPADRLLVMHLKVYDELFFNVPGEKSISLFDHNRAYAGLFLEYADHWSADIGYIYWLQQQTAGSMTDRHIIRITLTHTIQL